MAKKAYIGISNVARRVKKMYVGVGGVARKVKKGYIGVNGVARLFYQYMQELIKYTGTTPTLSSAGTVYRHLHTSFNNCGVYFPADFQSTDNTTVNVFNASLTRTDYTTSKPSSDYTGGGMGASDTYLIMAGWRTYNSQVSRWYGSTVAYAFNTSWTQTKITNLKYQHTTTGMKIGDYILYISGQDLTDNTGLSRAGADAYNSSLTLSNPSALTSIDTYGSYTYTDKYAAVMSAGSRIVSAYVTNSSLTLNTVTMKTYDTYSFDFGAAASVGGYMILAGGRYNSSGVSGAYALSDTLTVSTLTSLSVGREVPEGVSAGPYAIFAGGQKYDGTRLDVVESYDINLTKTINTSLSTARGSIGGTLAGNYVLLAGGTDNGYWHGNVNTIEVYQLV